jgi:hypothetical protein
MKCCFIFLFLYFEYIFVCIYIYFSIHLISHWYNNIIKI